MEHKIEKLNRKKDKRHVKCVVWDLDNTIWDGILLEGDFAKLRDNVAGIIKTLDSRGILQSIASKNEYSMAMEKLKEFDLNEYFLYPQINWSSKASSIKEISKSLNIGLDAIAFVDDQVFEREEVSFSIPEVFCIDAARLNQLLAMPEMNPRFITEDSKMRRKLYMCDIERNKAEEEYAGPKEEFLATLNMKFTICSPTEEDLKRAEELTIRTNQLNATGYTYSYDQLDHFRQSTNYKLLVASLEDEYGSYGKIGLALLECTKKIWTIKLFVMSCRVMSRGVGTVMINYIMSVAKKEKVHLRAEFLQTDRNRMMYIAYKFAGFEETEKIDDLIILENDLTRIQPFPEYVKVTIMDDNLCLP